jgi:hypothetical protein
MAQVGLYFWSIAFNCGNQRQTSNLIHLKYSRFGKFGAVPPLQTAFDLFFLGSAFRRSSLCLPECGTPKPLMVLITFPVVLVEASVKSQPLGSYEALKFFFFYGDFSRPKGSKRPKM